MITKLRTPHLERLSGGFVRAKDQPITISCVALLSRTHSHFSAIIGSIFVARRAGR
jgi:hypothetical protein